MSKNINKNMYDFYKKKNKFEYKGYTFFIKITQNISSSYYSNYNIFIYIEKKKFFKIFNGYNCIYNNDYIKSKVDDRIYDFKKILELFSNELDLYIKHIESVNNFFKNKGKNKKDKDIDFKTLEDKLIEYKKEV